MKSDPNKKNLNDEYFYVPNVKVINISAKIKDEIYMQIEIVKRFLSLYLFSNMNLTKGHKLRGVTEDDYLKSIDNIIKNPSIATQKGVFAITTLETHNYYRNSFPQQTKEGNKQ